MQKMHKKKPFCIHFWNTTCEVNANLKKTIAKDALDLIEVDYDALPAVVDPEKALVAGSTKVYDEFPDNVSFLYKLDSGDVAGAFKKAQRVIRQRIINQRLAPISMETRSVMAEYLPGEGTLTVHSSTQIPHLLRTQIAGMTGVAETKVRVIAPEVGGGFGCKLNVYPEEGLDRTSRCNWGATSTNG